MIVGVGIPPEPDPRFKRVPLRRHPSAFSPSGDLPGAATKRAGRRRPASRWSWWIRLARIQFRRTAHRIVRLFRRRSSLPEVPPHDRILAIKRAVMSTIRSVNDHRKAVAVVGLLLAAAAVMNWKDGEPAPAKPAVEKPVVILDDVKVFPPRDGRESPRGTGFQPVRETPRPDRAENANSGSDLSSHGRVGNPSHGAPAPRQAPRRPVWFTGTIEEVDPAESRVRAAGHTELPFTARPTRLADAPHVPRGRR